MNECVNCPCKDSPKCQNCLCRDCPYRERCRAQCMGVRNEDICT